MNSNKKQIGLIVILAVIIVVIAAGIVLFLTRDKKTETNTDLSAEIETQSQANLNQIDYNGKKYEYNANLMNILFLGIYKAEDIDTSYMPGEAGQADCIMLLSLDKETKEARIWQISRNTMTQVDLYDVNGDVYNAMNTQLATQYAYCIGGSRSCWATEKTVRNLLYDLPIDGYFSLSVDGISLINDAIGGVTVPMTEADEAMDPSFKAGTEVLLKGEKAEAYVRSRDLNTFDSNSDRMRRQVNYVTAMITQMRSHGGKALYDIVSPFLDKYIVTDLDAEQIDALSSYTYLTDDVTYLPGEVTMGETHEEFHVDEAKLQEMLIENFYQEVTK